jgi:hypothetical protein
MKHVLAVILAAMCCIAPLSASADSAITSLKGLTDKPVQIALDRTQTLSGMNPQSTWLNQAERDTRIGIGTFWWAEMCGSAPTCPGSFSNLSILPVTLLNVAVGPTVASTVGSLYQFLPEETQPYGGYPSGIGTFLPADTTQVMLQGLTAGNTSSMQMTGGVSAGQSVNNLVECQVVTFDTTSTTVQIVSPGGSVTSTAANRDRKDGITCQNKAGVSATTGTQITPTVDAGYVAVGYVAVPFGTVNVSTSMVHGGTSFNGFVQTTSQGSNAVFLSPSSTQTGNINVSGTIFSNALTVGTNGSINSINFYSTLTGTTNLNTNNTLTAGSISCEFLGLAYIGTEEDCFDHVGNFGMLGSAKVQGQVWTGAGSSSGQVVFGGLGIGALDYNLCATNTFTFTQTPCNGVYRPVVGGVYTNASDRRYKRNIKSTHYGLRTIESLNPRDFVWRDTGKADVGFIAQEVRSVIPEIVTADKRGFLGVNYSGIIPVLVKAMQEQQAEINALKAKVAKLRR